MQYERVRGFFNEIEQENWKVATGGNIDTKANGYYITPTIIDSPPETSRIVVEEPCGKLVSLLKSCHPNTLSKPLF